MSSHSRAGSEGSSVGLIKMSKFELLKVEVQVRYSESTFFLIFWQEYFPAIFLPFYF